MKFYGWDFRMELPFQMIKKHLITLQEQHFPF